MEIGFFFVHGDSDEHAVTRAVYAALAPRFAACGDRAYVHAVTPGPLARTVAHVLDVAQRAGYAWCVVSHGTAWTLDPLRLHDLLTSASVAQAAVSVRAGHVLAKAAVFSPKVTYVDAHGILLNVGRCGELGVGAWCSRPAFASHFADAGGIHADLLALLEGAVPHGALHVYDDGSTLTDWRGERRGFSMGPFHYDARTALATVTLPVDARGHALRAALLARCGLDTTPELRAYGARHAGNRRIAWTPNGAPYLSRPLPARALRTCVSACKRALGRVNYEIAKTYDDKT